MGNSPKKITQFCYSFKFSWHRGCFVDPFINDSFFPCHLQGLLPHDSHRTWVCSSVREETEEGQRKSLRKRIQTYVCLFPVPCHPLHLQQAVVRVTRETLSLHDKLFCCINVSQIRISLSINNVFRDETRFDDKTTSLASKSLQNTELKDTHTISK